MASEDSSVQTLSAQNHWCAEGHMFRTKSGLLARRWRVGGEVKTQRNGLSLSVSVLSVGTDPAMVPAECCHYVLWGPFTQRPLLCPWVHLCVWLCVCIWVPLLTCSGTLNLSVCVHVWALSDASLLLSPVEARRHNGVKRWERNLSGNERKSGTDRERQSEGVEEKHEVIGGTFTSAGSLTSHSLSFLSFSHSPSCSLCLFIISLPVAIPTTFSWVTQTKE